MANRADPAAGAYLAGTTWHLPPGRDREFFCDAVADRYAGVRPEVAAGRFDPDYARYQLGGDPSTSFRAFRRRYGTTPGQARQAGR